MSVDKAALAAGLLRWSGGGAILRAAPRWEGLLVLNYHRIGDSASSPYERDLYSATEAEFDRQIAFLRKHAEIVSPADLSALRRRASGRAVMISFDDGYRDNYELAFPILKRHGVPATFFVCTGFLDRGRIAWWDEIAWMIRHATRDALPAGEWFRPALSLRTAAERETAIAAALKIYKQTPGERTPELLDFIGRWSGAERFSGDARDQWMTWDMVRDLRDAGMTIGAHTDSHPLLGRLPPAEQEREIVISRDRIAAELGETPKVFAYPVGKPGAYDHATKRLLQAAGFSYGFNFQGGHQTFADFDGLDVRRNHVGRGMSLPVFQAIVTLPTVFAR